MITVLGSINMDLIAYVGRLPRPGETVGGHDFKTAAGGKGANQALAARRAGARVSMAGAVGTDQFAAEALTLLRYDATDLSRVAEAPGPTGIAVIFVGDDGENVIAVIPGANGTVTATHAEAVVAAMTAGDLLLLQMEIPTEANEAALREARKRGVTSVLNAAPMTADALRLSALADIVIVNETEFELMAGPGLSAPDRIEKAMVTWAAERGQTLVVTLGADGVAAVREGKVVRTKGLKIVPVDTVGAGDTFCGYFAASLDQGHSFADALKRAAVAGSLACLKAGAQPSIPLANDVARAL